MHYFHYHYWRVMKVKVEWLYCPVCGNKTRNRIREDTVLKNYPLYCPKCRQETLVEVKELLVKIIKEQAGMS